MTISLDDFGTAYSSLSHLQRLPLDTLKIDQSFISKLSDGSSDAGREISIVQAVVALGNSLGLRVVAEGVETEAQLSVLKYLGCHEVQGFLFARPGAAEEAELLMKRVCLQRN